MPSAIDFELWVRDVEPTRRVADPLGLTEWRVTAPVCWWRRETVLRRDAFVRPWSSSGDVTYLV